MNLSIIIPVYNLENYILDCLKSLKSAKCEIIIIDDGSTDNSLKKIKKFKQENSNLIINIYTQTNHGLSYTRNLGIEKAKNEYIIFLDGDDEIIIDELERMYSLVTQNSLDVLIGGYLDKFEKKEKLYMPIDLSKCTFNNKVLNGVDLLEKLLSEQCYNIVAVAKIYKKSFLIDNKIKFEVGRSYEDHEFTYKVLCNAKNAMQINIYPYIYKHRNESITSLPKEKNVSDLLVAINNINNLDYNINEKILNKIKSITYYHLISILCRMDYSIVKIYSKKISKREIIRCISNAYDSHVKKKLIVFLLSPKIVKKIQKNKY